MIIKINDDRGFETQTLYSGYLEENNSLTLEFEIPEYLEKYNKKLNFLLHDGTTVCKLFDDINSNKFTFTRDLLKFNKLQMAIEFFDTNEDLIYRTSILTIRISDSIICDDDVSEDDPKVVILDELIQKVNELNTEITENEATRESNEQTRISNEETRVANETAREEYVTQLKKDKELGNLDGATFTPQVNENGDLSWSNNKGLDNPQTVNIRGPEGKEGKKGEQGEPFRISKTYPSVEAMQSDFENMPIDSYVMIATSIELEDNAKLYYRAETEWVYITDFSGAVGIQGPKGDDGDTGAKGDTGDPGVGISKLEVIDGALYVTLTNNVKENAGVILTDEVKAWLVSQITDNAESDFNEYYNSKVTEFNNNATEKTTAYNDNASEKLSEYNTNATEKINEYNSNADAILKLLPSKTTEVQETIDIDDAAESSFNKLSVFGNSRQDTREGTNLLDFNVTQNEKVIVNEDGTITINGTGGFTLNFKEITLQQGVNYYQKYELVSGNINNSQVFMSFSGKTWLTPNNFTLTNVSEETNRSGMWIHNDAVFENAVIKIWANTDQSDFEQYGVSPSPNYPSEIEVIGNNINLFDKDNTNMFLDGLVPDNYGLIQVGATSTDNLNYLRTIIIECKPNTSYAISRYIEGKTFFVYESDVYPVEGSQTTLLKRNDSTGKISEIITTSESANYLLVKIYNTYVQEPIENKEFFENIKIEEGKVATSYSPYGMGSVAFKRIGKNYFNSEIEMGGYIAGGTKYASNTRVRYEPYNEDVYTLPVQQEMLTGDYIKDVEHHEWKKLIFDENSNMECIHNDKTFQFKFLKHIEGTEVTTKVICNMAKHWNMGAWEENGCFINFDGYFYILCKENEFGFNADMPTDEAITHFKTILANSKLIAYYKLATPINLELTEEQTAVLNQLEQFSLEKGINHIFSDDEISPKFKLKYYQDINILLDKINKNIADVSAEIL